MDDAARPRDLDGLTTALANHLNQLLVVPDGRITGLAVDEWLDATEQMLLRAAPLLETERLTAGRELRQAVADALATIARIRRRTRAP